MHPKKNLREKKMRGPRRSFDSSFCKDAASDASQSAPLPHFSALPRAFRIRLRARRAWHHASRLYVAHPRVAGPMRRDTFLSAADHNKNGPHACHAPFRGGASMAGLWPCALAGAGLGLYGAGARLPRPRGSASGKFNAARVQKRMHVHVWVRARMCTRIWTRKEGRTCRAIIVGEGVSTRRVHVPRLPPLSPMVGSAVVCHLVDSRGTATSAIHVPPCQHHYSTGAGRWPYSPSC